MQREPFSMNKTIATLTLSLAASLAVAGGAAAQNLIISNARIIVGPGQVIESGAIVVRDGRIASVAAGAAPSAPQGTPVIDATGMTVIAGYIDDHRHLIQGRGPEAVARFMKEQAPARMREFLEAGFTTVQSGGDDNAGILELKQRIERGEIKGPRIITSGQVPTPRFKDEAEVRAALPRSTIRTSSGPITRRHRRPGT